MNRKNSSLKTAWVLRGMLFAGALSIPAGVHAAAPTLPVLMEIPEDAVINTPEDLARLARIVKPSLVRKSATSPIFSTNDSFVVISHTFDTPAGSCLPRGWTFEERAGLQFAHVSTRHVLPNWPLLGTTPIMMGTKALWVGADGTTAPQELTNWVGAYGYGNNWSERLASPPIPAGSYASPELSFDTMLELGTSALVTSGLLAEFFSVELNDVPLKLRVTTDAVSEQLFSNGGIRGKGIFRCVVRFGQDGNPTLSPGSTIRIVTTTDGVVSNEDGGVPLGWGASVVDNVRLVDTATSTDILAAVDFEDGTTGDWSLSSFTHGTVPQAIAYTRDGTLPSSDIELVQAFDTNDPSCVWKFTNNATGELGGGHTIHLTSPWFPTYRSATPPALSWAMKFPSQAGGTPPHRAFGYMVRGKNAGLGLQFVRRPGFTVFFAGTYTDDEAPMVSFSTNPGDISFSPILPSVVPVDSVQFVIRILDRPEGRVGIGPPVGGPSGTRLPFVDDPVVTIVAVDADHDGVADAVDACPTESAAGQDADGDGCVDAGATLRHAESWSAGRPIRFTVSANGHPDITDGSDIQAVVDGFQAWQGVQGSSLAVQVDPTTSDVSSSPFDERNLVTFEDANISLPPNVVAVTPTTSFLRRTVYNDEPRRPGEIVDADMIFNAALDYSTATHDGGPLSFDLESVVAHEAGHFLGLSHSGVLDATMFFVLQPGTGAASLEEDDLAAIASAYPSAALYSDFGTIVGHVRRGGTSVPIPGALVTAVRLGGGAPQDSVASDYTDEDGAYALRRLPPGDYAVRVTPLDGEVGGYPLTPEYISARVEASAVTIFPAEWWDAAESGTEFDDPDALSPVTVVAGVPVTGIDVITNVDTTPPQVSSVFPAGGAIDVGISSGILVNFSERIDRSTLTGATFLLRQQGLPSPISGGGFTLDGDRSFYFSPSPPLQFNASYELELTTGIRDREGVALAAPYITSFSTEARPNVAITDVQPRSATVGSFITLLGAGFDATVSNDVSFTFCPTCTPVPVTGSNVTPSSLVARIPDGVISGPVQVTVNTETSNAFNLTILPPSPQAAPSSDDRFQLPSAFSPSDVSIAPDGLTLYAVGAGGFATVSLDPQNPDFRVPRIEPLAAGRSMALTADGKRAYVTRRDQGDVIAVDADPSSGTFRQILRTIPLEFASTPAAEAVPGLPEGIAIAGSGKRAYVTDRLEGVVFELDIDPRSLTRDKVVGQIRDADAVLMSGVTVSPGSDKVFFATSNLGGRSFDLASAASSTVNTQAGGDGAAVTPSGGEVLFTGGGVSSGRVLFTRLDAPGEGTIEIGGDLRDVATSPRGQSAFVVNATYNLLQVVNVDPLSPSYHSVVAQSATEGNPSAVHVSADGNLIAVANQGSSSISLFGTGAAGQIVRVSPAVGSPGDAVAVTLSPGLDLAGASVDLGEGPFLVSRSAPASAGVAFAVPSTAQRDAGVVLVEADGDRTLTAGFRVVDSIEGLSPKTTALRLSPVAVDCGGTPAVGSLDLVRVSPDGRQVALARGTPCAVLLDLYRSGDDTRFAELLTTATLSAAAGQVVALAYSPDGRRIWASIGTADILEVDADPTSPTLGVVTSFAASPVGVPRAIEADPLGRSMIVADAGGAITFWSVSPRSVISTLTTGLSFRSMAVGRDARHALVGGAGQAAIVDLDARTLLGLTAAQGSSPIRSIAIVGNGRRAVGAFESGSIAIWNLAPSAGAVGAQLYFGNPLPGGVVLSQLIAAPDGDGVLGGCSSCADLVKLEAGVLPPTVTTAAIGRTSAALARSHDGRQVWIAEWNTGAGTGDVALASLSDASQLALVSGADQAGATGTTLPIPVGVRATDASGRPQVGVVVSFELGSGLGSLDGQGTRVNRVTDANGEARVNWTLPATPATETLSISGLGVTGGNLAVTAEAVGLDSQILPQVVAFGPANGAADISVGSAAFVRFNQRINQSLVNLLKVRMTVGNGSVDHFKEFLEDGRVVIMRPLSPLPFGAVVTLQVLAGTLDTDGQATATLAAATFTVQSEPPLSLRSLSPPATPLGAPVVLAGQGFSLIAAQNIVSFNGVLADVISATFEELRVNVPQGAATGPVTVTIGAVTSNAVQYTLPAPAVLVEILEGVQASPGVRDIAITEDGGHAYVTNPSIGAVSAIRLNPPTLLASITAGLMPQGIAIVPGIRRAYVANTLSNDLSVIDVNSTSPTFNKEIGRVVVKAPAPVDVAVNPIGPEVIAVHADDAGTISFIDADPQNGTYNRVTSTTNTGSGGTGVAITADGTRGYVLTRDGKLIELNLKPGVPPDQRVVSTTNTGSGGNGVAISTDGTRFVVVITSDGDLLVVDIVPGSATRNQVVATTNTGSGGGGVAVTADGGSAYVTTSNNEVLRFNIRFAAGSVGGSVIPGSVVTLELVERKPTELAPAGVAVEPTGPRSVVANEGTGTVQVFGPIELLPPPVAQILFEPRTLSLGSSGGSVTVAVELPLPFQSANIVPASVMLNESVPAGPAFTMTDRDFDGVQEMVLTFSRVAVGAVLPAGERVQVRVSGMVGTHTFSGVDTIRVKASKKGVAVARMEESPVRPELLLISANPARDGASLAFGLPSNARALVEVFDLAGRRVATLADGEREAGWHTVSWDGGNDRGGYAHSGVYFTRLTTSGVRIDKRIVFMR